MTYRWNGTTKAPPATGCGTRNGYRQHRREGTPACGPCNQANAAFSRHIRRKNPHHKTPFNPDACGTYRGYRRHQSRGLTACPPCKKANTNYRPRKATT